MIRVIPITSKPFCPVCKEYLELHIIETKKSRDCYWTCPCLENIKNKIISGKYMADSYAFDGRYQDD